MTQIQKYVRKILTDPLPCPHTPLQRISRLVIFAVRQSRTLYGNHPSPHPNDRRCYIYYAEHAIPGHAFPPRSVSRPSHTTIIRIISICLHLVGSQKIPLDNPWFCSHVFTGYCQIHLTSYPHIPYIRYMSPPTGKVYSLYALQTYTHRYFRTNFQFSAGIRRQQ